MIALITPFQKIYGRLELIRELVNRELRDRHTGQSLGVLWAFGHPLLLMLVYTFLFAYVFPTRFGSGDSARDFSVNVLAGIVPWLTFQDILARGPSILVSHSNLVKQIVFPTEVLPVKTAIASALPYAAGIAFILLYASWHGTLTWLSLGIVWLAFCQIIAMIGTAFLLAAIGVFFRDLRDIIQVFCSINLFAQPILYSPAATPEWLQWVFLANPFSYLTWCWQDALYNGTFAHPIAWVVFPLGSFMILALGWTFFERTRVSFGDAL